MSTSTQKLLATALVSAALLLGATASASANPWRGAYGPRYRPAPFVAAPVYRVPIYRAPVVLPPRAVVYPAPVYGPVYQPVYRPVYRPVMWRPHTWVRPYGYRF